MAIQIAGVKDKLKECATEEFLAKGFELASLRVIAKNAKTSTSSIYVRFKDKHGLFQNIVEQVAEDFKAKILLEQESFNYINSKMAIEEMFIYTTEKVFLLVDWVYDNFNYFKLLICKAAGTTYADFIGDLAQISAEQTIKYIQAIHNDAIISKRLTPELLHMLCSGYWTGFFEVVRHDMDRETAKKYFMTIQQFYQAGWRYIFIGK